MKAEIGERNLYCKAEKRLSHLVGKKYTENRFEDEDYNDEVKEQLLPRLEKGDKC